MIRCPICLDEITEQNFNVSTDLAYCPKCKQNFAYSALVKHAEKNQCGEPEICPLSIRIQEDSHGITATHKRFSYLCIGLFFFSLIWNLITWTIISAMFLSNQTGDAMPQWFLLVFMTPFVIVGIITFFSACYSCAGKQSVRIEEDRLRLFHGIGVIGLRRVILISEIHAVSMKKQIRTGNDGGPRDRYYVCITLNSGATRELYPNDGEEPARYLTYFIQEHIHQSTC